MQRVLLGLAASIAATAITASPALAQDGPEPAFAATSGGASSFERDSRSDGDWRRDRDRRRHRGDRVIFYGNREYQGDSAWRPNGFNDWWHERPHRSYPAWMARNTNCERLWWSGGDWRC